MSKTISTLAVDLTANTAKFTKDMVKAQKRSKSFGDSLSSMSKVAIGSVAAMGASVAAGIKLIANEMDAAAHTANKLGLSTQALTSLRHAVEQTSDVTAGQFDTALQRMTRRLAEAAQGSGEAQGALEELGLDAQRLAAMSPDQAFKKVADAMQGVESQSDRVRLAFKLFDSEGVGLVNTLAEGSAGIEKLQRQAVELGIAFDDKAAAGAQRFNDNLDVLGKTFKGTMVSLVNESDVLDILNERFKTLSETVENWRRNNTAMKDPVNQISKELTELKRKQKELKDAPGWQRVLYGKSYEIDVERTNSAIAKKTAQMKQLIEQREVARKWKKDVVEFAAIPFDLPPDEPNKGEKKGKDVEPVKSFSEYSREINQWSEARNYFEGQSFGEEKAPLTASGMMESQSATFGGVESVWQKEQEAARTQMDTLATVYAEGLDRERIFQNERLAMVENALQQGVISVEKAADLEAKIKDKYRDEELTKASDGFGMIAKLMNTNSKEMFEIGKKAAIVKTTIDTYQMAVGAYNSMSSIPYIGPALGAAAAASAVAFGLAQVSAINSQQFTPSAAGGYDIPSGVNPVTQLHEKEMVLPKQHAEVIRGLAKNGGAGNGVEVHIHNAPGNAEVQQNGNRIDITFIKDMVSSMQAKELMEGTSPLNPALEHSYGVYR